MPAYAMMATPVNELPDRSYAKSNTEVHACRCGAIVVVPQGHAALDDDKDTDVLCDSCDKPLGLKLYETFA